MRISEVASIAALVTALMLSGPASAAGESFFLVEARGSRHSFESGRSVFFDVLIHGRTGHETSILVDSYFSTKSEPPGATLQIRIWRRVRGGSWVELEPSEVHAEPALPSPGEFLLLREGCLFGTRIYLADAPFETELSPGVHEVKAQICTWIRSYLAKQADLASRIRATHEEGDWEKGVLIPEGCVMSNTIHVTISGSSEKKGR